MRPTSDPVIGLLATTPADQLHTVLRAASEFVATHPKQAKALLTAQPQLAFALNLALDRLYGPAHGAMHQAAARYHQPSPPPPPPPIQNPQHLHQQPAVPRPRQPPPPPPLAAQGAPVARDPRMAQAQPVAMPADGEARALLEQVLQLQPEQIAALPPAERAQIEQLKAQALGLQR